MDQKPPLIQELFLLWVFFKKRNVHAKFKHQEKILFKKALLQNNFTEKASYLNTGINFIDNFPFETVNFSGEEKLQLALQEMESFKLNMEKRSSTVFALAKRFQRHASQETTEELASKLRQQSGLDPCLLFFAN